MNPDAIFNGTFVFDGYQTGSDFADFLIGAPNQFNQQDSGHYYPRHRYAGWYAQDSWRIKPNLTLNYGLRMELMRLLVGKIQPGPHLYSRGTIAGVPQRVSRDWYMRRIRVCRTRWYPKRFGTFRASAWRIRRTKAMDFGERFSEGPERPASAPATGFLTPSFRATPSELMSLNRLTD